MTYILILDAKSSAEMVNISKLISTLSSIIQGKERALELSLICLLARGHLLIEDLPGVGKTTLALVLAKSLGLSFGRIQGTSDLLPSDITGTSVYNKKTETFEFYPGPIFNNVVLVDEINRMSPKTQSALLEPLEECQVTVDGKTYPLPQPFFLIATQNPIEFYGTFPLPEAQLDRFLMRISIGYPPRALEKEILKRGSLREEIKEIEPVLTAEDVITLQKKAKEVVVSEKILDYVLYLVEETRRHPDILVGLSTRGALSLIATARSRAILQGRDYVIPEDIKALARYVITHRLILRDQTTAKGEEVIEELLKKVPPPVF